MALHEIIPVSAVLTLAVCVQNKYGRACSRVHSWQSLQQSASWQTRQAKQRVLLTSDSAFVIVTIHATNCAELTLLV